MDDQRFETRVLLRWFWSGYVRRVLPFLIIGGIMMAVEGASLGALSYMVRPMFDDVLVAGNTGAIYAVSAAVCGIFLARAVTGYLRTLFMAVAARRTSQRLQSDLVSHIVTLSGSFFLKHAPGKLIERVRGDINGAVQFVTITLSAFGRDLISLVSLLAVAVSIDWVWTLVALAGVPLIVLPVLAIQRLMRNLVRRSRNQAASVLSQLDEIFHGIDTIKLNAIETQQASRFAKMVRYLTGTELRVTAAQAGIPALMDVVAAIGFLGVLIYGGMQIANGSKTVGDFMSFFTAIALLFEPVRRLGALAGNWQRAVVSMERIYAVLQVKPEILSPARPKPLPDPVEAADLTLEHVSFAYGDTTILDDVSLTAKAGQTTALVGASGAGKTTLLRLIPRLIDPQTGAVSLGGTDLREFDLNALRTEMAVVTQDTLLFDQPLAFNITLGADHPDDRLAAALEAAHVSEFSANLPDGLDSPAGPRGANLSGGQRQRIAIARALLRDAPILLLDEATSALDTKSEAIVQDAIGNLSRNRTTLVIAHRLSTIRNADLIVVMDKGRIVDQGTHDELMARDGLYAGLYRIQFRD